MEQVLAAGSTFADYVIDDVLARGGMGVVYRATQQQPRRRVALKLIAPDRAADASYRERFLREMDTLASIEHPNIVPVHAAGEWQGQLYLAMRLVDGPDLGTMIAREGPMSLGRAVAVVVPVADALDAAHGAGLVHRDVKPANILIDQRGAVYLTDFGLTKRSISASGPTMTGQAIGSPGYMSPEQFTTGISTDPAIAAKTDQYALACVLYACLTGQEPYHRDTWEAAMWAHVYAPIPRLSERRPDLPPRLDEVLDRALAKDPADRYPSVVAFVEDVRALAPAAERLIVAGQAAAAAAAASPTPAPTSPSLSPTPPPSDASPAVPTPPPAPITGELPIATAPSAPPPPPKVGAPASDRAPGPDLPPAPADRRRVSEVVAQPPPGASQPGASQPSGPPPGDVPSGQETVVGSAWGARASTGSGTSATPPSGRRPSPAVLGGIAAVIAVVVIGGAFALNGGGGGAKPTPTPRATAAASFGPLPSAVIATYAPTADPTVDPTTEPATDPGIPPVDPAATARLRAMIPASVEPTCTDVAPYRSLASVACNAPGTSFFYYALYPDSTAQQDDWALTLSTAGVDPGAGSCPDAPAENAWHFGDGPDEGRIFCSVLEDTTLGKVQMGWSDESALVSVFMWGEETSVLYDLWLTGDYHVVEP